MQLDPAKARTKRLLEESQTLAKAQAAAFFGNMAANAGSDELSKVESGKAFDNAAVFDAAPPEVVDGRFPPVADWPAKVREHPRVAPLIAEREKIVVQGKRLAAAVEKVGAAIAEAERAGNLEKKAKLQVDAVHARSAQSQNAYDLKVKDKNLIDVVVNEKDFSEE